MHGATAEAVALLALCGVFVAGLVRKLVGDSLLAWMRPGWLRELVLKALACDFCSAWWGTVGASCVLMALGLMVPDAALAVELPAASALAYVVLRRMT